MVRHLCPTKTSTIRVKHRDIKNTELKQRQTPTYMKTDYLITTTIFLRWFGTVENNCGLNLDIVL